MINIESCPVCEGREFKEFITAKDYLITNETFRIVNCSKCSFLFTNPRPADSELGEYYKSSNYDSHNTKKLSIKDFLYNRVRTISTKRKLDYIRSITKGNTLLDIGCGAGYFLNYCSQHNWQVEGMEPNLDEIPLINKTIRIHKSLNTIPKNTFDIITMWHSLEHVPNLNEVLTVASNSLNQGGKIIIAVPNINAYDFKTYRHHWAALDVPRHLYHFSQKSLGQLLAKFDLQIIKVSPMPFDSYYVSLLSEKYRTGSTNYFRAFNNGLISNSWAKKNNNDYSSLMYTVAKNG